MAETNRYFAGQEPWKLGKTDPARLRRVLYVTAEMLRIIAILCQPFIPEAAARLLDLLGVEAGRARFRRRDAGEHRLCAGASLPAPAPIFPRYVEPEAGVARLRLIDTHCHLDFPDFADGSRGRARASRAPRASRA